MVRLAQATESAASTCACDSAEGLRQLVILREGDDATADDAQATAAACAPASSAIVLSEMVGFGSRHEVGRMYCAVATAIGRARGRRCPPLRVAAADAADGDGGSHRRHLSRHAAAEAHGAEQRDDLGGRVVAEGPLEGDARLDLAGAHQQRACRRGQTAAAALTALRLGVA